MASQPGIGGAPMGQQAGGVGQQHRASMHGAQAASGGSAVAALHANPASHRLPELLEAIKAEFQTLADEMHVYKMQRDEYAEKCKRRSPFSVEAFPRAARPRTALRPSEARAERFFAVAIFHFLDWKDKGPLPRTQRLTSNWPPVSQSTRRSTSLPKFGPTYLSSKDFMRQLNSSTRRML